MCEFNKLNTTRNILDELGVVNDWAAYAGSDNLQLGLQLLPIEALERERLK